MMEAEAILEVVRRMVAADHAAGCGFYSDDDWIAAYNELAAMAGVKTGYAQYEDEVCDEQAR